MYRVLLTGPAGSGKNTICKLIVKECDQFGCFSAGDIIRDHIQKGTEFGQRAQSFLNKGEHVPDSMINGLLINELKKAPSKLILNGYPRNLNQVKQVEEFCPLNLVVALKLDTKILMDRLSKQLVHPASGRAYNLNFNPPKVEGKDDITGEPLFPRLDDQMEIARRRIEIYDKTETKVVDYYRKQGILISISGDRPHEAVAVVVDHIQQAMKKRAYG
ncbi:hypothetical protein WR25_00095 [Diploscapter pachys]|uniref:Adenylate kinase active site lid domain-containing protein n=1 Tax=Diploscapter pachys TaxID=2018661 RepID=A0A2A2KEN2_9BILA|nr:hypothetical protein WR25_00095 [Diploscapter pachys]